MSLSSTKKTLDTREDIEIIYLDYDFSEESKASKIKKIYDKFILIINIRKSVSRVKPDVIVAFMADIVRIVVIALKGKMCTNNRFRKIKSFRLQ